MPQAYWIIPMEGGPAPGVPTHPIAPGGQPGYPSHPIAPGGERPTHPIAPGGPPPGIWGGGGVGNYPDAGFPAPQPPMTGNRPTNPIYYPPVIWPPDAYPDQSLPVPPTPPLTIWGGGGVGNYPDAGGPAPQPPAGGEPERTPVIEWKTAWSPATGWVVVGVPSDEAPVPTPSA
jgi:hypothetical protein